MRLDCRQLTARVIRRSAIGSLASFTALSGFVAAGAMADQAEDALAKLNELSRQAEQTTEAMHSAELELGAKLAAQQAAENKLTDDQAALDATKGQLASFQTAVNKVAAAAYMGGRANGMDTILTAPSPQLLIDGLSMQRVMVHQMATQMSGFRTAREQTAKLSRPPRSRPPMPSPPPNKLRPCGQICSTSRASCRCRSRSSSRSTWH